MNALVSTLEKSSGYISLTSSLLRKDSRTFLEACKEPADLPSVLGLLHYVWLRSNCIASKAQYNQASYLETKARWYTCWQIALEIFIWFDKYSLFFRLAGKTTLFSLKPQQNSPVAALLPVSNRCVPIQRIWFNEWTCSSIYLQSIGLLRYSMHLTKKRTRKLQAWVERR